MSYDYSLAMMLPFARSALKPINNFEIRHFMETLFSELEKAQVPVAVKMSYPGQLKYNYSDPICPDALRRAASEVFFYIVHGGYIPPEPQSFPTAFTEYR
jgi:hypothetical protein